MENFIPVDRHVEELLANVHPSNWQNPTPAPRYNLVVIGAGPAGLVAAAGAAGLGAKVALVERHLMGGDCLNVGCVPSKALLRCARAAADARRARAFGIHASDVQVDFAAVMEHVRGLRAKLSAHDSAQRFKSLGVDVFLGEGQFTGPKTVSVANHTLLFSKALIATGARAIILPIPGLRETGCLTNETIFQLTELPRRLAVIGAGPIGCEMAQAFARLGAKVDLFEAEGRILPREDADAATLLENSLQRDGVAIHTGANVESVSRSSTGKQITAVIGSASHTVAVDEILLGVGRAPNIESLNLEAAGIASTRAGVTINAYLQTSNRRVYAAGDVCLPHKFTHSADASARIVLENALFPGRRKISSLVIPWCTYTDPEIAHVGAYASEGSDSRSFLHTFEHLDRAVVEGQEGFIKLHTSL
jgi:pyruvate/2-oxoglutarate dehydrogenase complex dihydrolipoamide dehydrogenase (E3) component